MTTTATSTDPHVVALAARILPLLPRIDAGNDVREWPDDEAELHRRRGWRSFTERSGAVDLYRREKLARAIAEDLAADYEHTRDDQLTVGAVLCSDDDEPEAVGVAVVPIKDGGCWMQTGSSDKYRWRYVSENGEEATWTSWDDLAYPPGVVVVAVPKPTQEA